MLLQRREFFLRVFLAENSAKDSGCAVTPSGNPREKVYAVEAQQRYNPCRGRARNFRKLVDHDNKPPYYIKEPALNTLISPSEGSRNAILQTVISNGYEIKEFQLKTIFEILRFANLFNRTVENHLKRYELSHGKFGVLLLLLTSPEVVWTPADLAAHLGCTRSTITGLLEGLERAGWIEKTTSTDDRRSFEIVLSKKGKKQFLAILPDHFKRVSNVVHGFSETDAEDARELLKHLAKNLELMKED